MGALANEVRERIANAIADKNEKLEEEEMKQKLAGQTIDVTLPGNPVAVGGRHPLTVVIEEIEDLFIGMGYTVEEGPEVKRITTTSNRSIFRKNTQRAICRTAFTSQRKL